MRDRNELQAHAIETIENLRGMLAQSGLKPMLQKVIMGAIAVFGTTMEAMESRRDFKAITYLVKGVRYLFERWDEVKADVQRLAQQMDKDFGNGNEFDLGLPESFDLPGSDIGKPKPNNRLKGLPGFEDEATGLN